MERSQCHITNCQLTNKKDFSKQYFKTYCIRLKRCTDILVKEIYKKWGNDVCLKNLSEIVPDEKCVIIGTLYKKMENKPSVIKEWTDAYQLGILPVAQHKLIGKDDKIILEDFQQQIQLQFDEVTIKTASLVTGITCAVIGYEPESGIEKFIVEDIVFPTLEFPLLKNVNFKKSGARFIAIISGLRLNDETSMNLIRLRLFSDWISGMLPVDDFKIDPSAIGRLIVAGNLIDDGDEELSLTQETPLVRKSEVGTVNSLIRLDELLCGFCRTIQVDVMPGKLDPTSLMLPQNPFNRVMFPQSSKWSSFNARPNPWQCSLDDGRFLVGTSGDSIDDIDRYSDLDEVHERMAASIRWGHLAPTAPDSQECYPNEGPNDPLALLHRPHIYFAGNQDQFSWKRLEYEDSSTDSTLLVAVPRFSETGQVVFIDLLNSNCQSLTFK